MTRRTELVSSAGEVVSLDEPPFLVDRDFEVLGMPPVELATVASPGVPGVRVASRQHAPADLAGVISIVADSVTEFDRARRRLARVLDPVRGDVVLRVFGEDGSGREIEATLTDGYQRVALQRSWSTSARIPVVLTAHGAYWRAVNETSVDIIATEFEGAGQTSFNAPIPFNAPAPFNGFHASGLREFSIDMQGDVEAWPQWRIVGPGSAISLFSVSAGEVTSLVPALAEDDVLTIDTDPAHPSVRLNDSNGFPLLSTDSTLWSLRPGRNRIGVRIREWQPNVTELLLTYRERMLVC